ncbi:MAG: permease [Myxococcota bacterium]
MIDGTFLLLVALLVGLGALSYARGGRSAVDEGLRGGVDLLLRFGPVIVISFLAAGFAERLVPQEWVRARLDHGSGLTGILIGAGAGVVTPAGPFVSMPIAAVLLRSGAGVGAVVAFLSAWSLLSLHRLLAWEVPILGWRFAALRYGICVVVPVVAGLVARSLVRG